MGRLGWCLGLTLAVLGAFGQQAQAQEGHVYRYRDAEGREVFTNLEGLATGDQRKLERLSLPPLSTIDFTAAAPAELERLDLTVRRAHESLQSGMRCQEIRAASRIPTRIELWQRHQRELLVSACLLGFAFLLSVIWRRPQLRAAMPLVPFIGACYVGYVALDRTKVMQAQLREGLRACTSELPEGNARNSGDVRTRLSSALELQATIDRVYEERERRVDRIMQMR